jgi:hypothetical protein
LQNPGRRTGSSAHENDEVSEAGYILEVYENLHGSSHAYFSFTGKKVSQL